MSPSEHGAKYGSGKSTLHTYPLIIRMNDFLPERLETSRWRSGSLPHGSWRTITQEAE